MSCPSEGDDAFAEGLEQGAEETQAACDATLQIKAAEVSQRVIPHTPHTVAHTRRHIVHALYNVLFHPLTLYSLLDNTRELKFRA